MKWLHLQNNDKFFDKTENVHISDISLLTSLVPVFYFIFHQGEGRAWERGYLPTVTKIWVENVAHCTYKTDCQQKAFVITLLLTVCTQNVPFVDKMPIKGTYICWEYTKGTFTLGICIHCNVDWMYTFVDNLFIFVSICTQYDVCFLLTIDTMIVLRVQYVHKRHLYLF